MKIIKERVALAGVVLIFVLSLGLQDGKAQTITSGVIEGVVVDQNAAPLIEVLVQITSRDGGPARSAVSNRSGVFRFSLIPAGRYDVTVERIGYRPVIVEDVRVSSNARSSLEVRLVETPPPVDEAERKTWSGAATGTRAGASQLLSPFTLDEVPWEVRELGELPRLASSASRDFEVEGLPAWMNTVRVDGVPYHAARHPFINNSTRYIGLPINALSVGELVTGDADAEWGGAAGGTLSAMTRRGGNELVARGFGAWAGNALASSDLFTSDVEGTSLWGGALVGGAIIRDTAQVMVGVEVRKLQTPAGSVWRLDESTAGSIISSANARGEDLAAYTLPYAFESTNVSAFGRFDWQLAGNNQVSVRAALGSTSPGTSAFDLASAAMPAATPSARDLLISGALSSILSSNWAHEIRVGFSNSTREHSDESSLLLPATTIVNGALIGGAQLLGDFGRSDLTVDQSLQIPWDNHQIKLGIGVGMAFHDNTVANNAAGEFTFGSAAGLAGANGLNVQTTNAAPEVSFSTLHVHGFAQDTWLAAPGVQLVLAARIDMQTLPQKDVRPEAEWLAASGLDNTLFDDNAMTVSPRFGLTWDVGARGNVLLRFNAGRFAGEIDPLILSEVLAGDGDVTVRRSFGALGAWPAAPSASAGSIVGKRLALLGPKFRGPQSDRFGIGISSRAGALGTVHLSGAYRKTGYLPRRTDLNLANAATGQDQNGRAVLGSLSQSGQMLTAAGTNRRFRGYDVVTGITADGTSEYRAFTVGLEKDAGRALKLFGSYTYSSTTDDWPSRELSRPESHLSPFPTALTEDWLEGTSDYDLPHRAVAGFQFTPAVALSPHITAVYRYQSGYPFTPGFRAGVDANGDGSDNNDPAFVDTNINGLSGLIGQFDCLSGQAGQFAERNSCRGDGTHELDLRFGLSVLTSGRTSAQLYVEGINLMDAQFSVPDRALVLIDPTNTIQTNATTGNVSVPLIANPNFGQPLMQRGSGRMLRIGLQVTH